VAEQLLENPRALNEAFANALGGTEVRQPGLNGFLNSRFDRFLNQLFASADIGLRDAAAALGGRPGFVWLRRRPAPVEGLKVVETTQMTATLDQDAGSGSRAGEITDVRSRDDIDDWFEVYSAVFGADPRARDEWRRIHAALGPAGEDSLLLLLARVDGAPAATGAVFFHEDLAGLYCFTTLESMRGGGLATALVDVSHQAALARGVDRALLQATGSGQPVYAKAGYKEELELSLLLMG
jgi:GNAT superfamily N-acetyltransferase